MKHSLIGPAALGAVAALTLAACSAPAAPEDRLAISTAVYPLQFVAERITGDLATVSPLSDSAVEPHDMELSPAAVRRLADADLVLYIGEFQAAVDHAIGTTNAHALNAGDLVALHSSDHDHEDEAHEGDAHVDEEEDHEAHDHGTYDPHFWLSPVLLAEYAQGVGDELVRLDPDHAEIYTANTASLIADLTDLDVAFASGLSQCQRREMVVSHEAFGYLAEDYHLEQIGVAGIDPDTEPSPARLLEIRDLIAEHGATTIFTESEVSASVVTALARDAGVETAILSPLETISEGNDYLSVMRDNLETLRSSLACE